MKIGFITDHKNFTVGSYRIFVEDLCYYFNQINVYSKILTKNDIDIDNFDVLIYKKG